MKLKFNDKRTVDAFLKIVSEVSVEKAYSLLKENIEVDRKNYTNAKKNQPDYKKAPNLSEAEGDEEEPPEESQPEEESQTDQQQEEPKEERREPQEGDDYWPHKQNPSSEDIVTSINKGIRSAPSIEKDVKDMLTKFIDKQEDESKKLLYYFLQCIGGVLQGLYDPEAIYDHENPPTNVDTVDTSGNVDKPEDKKPPESSNDKVIAKDITKPEDDSMPPIKVNEQQEKEKIKEKIRRLMESW